DELEHLGGFVKLEKTILGAVEGSPYLIEPSAFPGTGKFGERAELGGEPKKGWRPFYFPRNRSDPKVFHIEGVRCNWFVVSHKCISPQIMIVRNFLFACLRVLSGARLILQPWVTILFWRIS